MTNDSKTTASEVHRLLLEAKPEVDNVNLARAAHITEASGTPRNDHQLETFVAVRNIRTAIENGADAVELQKLLRRATSLAEHWAVAS